MKKSIILAAGKGTRMKSDLPKVVHKVCGREMINRVLDATKEANIDEDIVIIGYKGDEVKDCIDRDVKFALQTEQLGTGHAVKCALDNVNDEDEVIILCGDVPLVNPNTIKKVYDSFESNHDDIIVASIVLDDPAAYGRIVKDENGHVTKIVEFKECDENQKLIKEINVGMYIVNGKVLRESLNKVDNNNAAHEYYFTDIIRIANEDGYKVSSYEVDDYDEGRGVNTPEDLAKAEEIFMNRNI